MAIPLIVGLVAGAAGLYKTGKAISDNNDAKKIGESANQIVKDAESKLNNSRQLCEKKLKDLGQKKADILRNNVNSYITTFQKIKNIDFQHNEVPDISIRDFSDITLAEMHKSISFVLSSGLGLGSGSVAGALTAFGAYNGTMMLAAAGTGTTISSLSGVAATNATLAWLGGGTLASGGMGVAGGTMALGALAAGPALLVAGWYMGSKAKANLNDAHSNKAEAEKYAADCYAAIALTNGIGEVATLATNILTALDERLLGIVNDLQQIILEQGTDFRQYNKESQSILFRSVKIIQVVKLVIDTPILNEKGDLLGDASSNLNQLHRKIKPTFRGFVANNRQVS